jgi:hypothetical protein
MILPTANARGQALCCQEEYAFVGLGAIMTVGPRWYQSSWSEHAGSGPGTSLAVLPRAETVANQSWVSQTYFFLSHLYESRLENVRDLGRMERTFQLWRCFLDKNTETI